MKTCVYPGSFDPFTDGHLDIALRAGDLFDNLKSYKNIDNCSKKQYICNSIA